MGSFLLRCHFVGALRCGCGAHGVPRDIAQALPLWIPIELPDNDRRGKRGSFKGAKGIPLRSLSFLFDDLMFLRISSKSLKSQRCCFRFPPPLPTSS